MFSVPTLWYQVNVSHQPALTWAYSETIRGGGAVGLLERLPRMRKVGNSNPSRYRPYL